MENTAAVSPARGETITMGSSALTVCWGSSAGGGASGWTGASGSGSGSRSLMGWRVGRWISRCSSPATGRAGSSSGRDTLWEGSGSEGSMVKTTSCWGSGSLLFSRAK